jgi:hypothetical protein
MKIKNFGSFLPNEDKNIKIGDNVKVTSFEGQPLGKVYDITGNERTGHSYWIDLERYGKMEFSSNELEVISDIKENNQQISTGSKVYIVIDKNMHSYEAILGIYDTFEKAMNCNAWANRGEVPDKEGNGDSLFIYDEFINKELVPKF